MAISKTLLIASLTLILLTGCMFEFTGSDTLFPVGTPFVLSGTATVTTTALGSCSVWMGENGVTYYLFQDPALENELFDKITTPGVSSRLELNARFDLEVTCHDGPVVEVLDVLEIVE